LEGLGGRKDEGGDRGKERVRMGGVRVGKGRGRDRGRGGWDGWVGIGEQVGKDGWGGDKGRGG